MADFTWMEVPKWGTCITCGSSSNPDGFVDLIADTQIVREGYEMVGTVDVVLCADCLTQAARAIGCIPKKESEELTWENKSLNDQLVSTTDDVLSWQQRYENLVEILSLVQLSKNGDPNDSGIDFSSAGGPTPDLRLAEGEPATSEDNRKNTKQRKGTRA